MWLAGGFVLLVSFPARWWEVTLVSGVTIPVRGVEFSALATTLVAVSAAAFGAGLLLRGALRRLVAVISASGALGGALALLVRASEPQLAVVDVITQLTGVSGSAALESVGSVSGGAWLFVALGGATLMTGGAALGAFGPDRPLATSRYERGVGGVDPQDSVGTWDTLSDGVDPTKR